MSPPLRGGVNTGKLLAAIAGGDAPDIALSDNASAAYSFAANGTAIPWDMSKITLKISDMLPGMKEVTQIDGKTYLLPQDSNVIMLYMNVKVFKDAGLDVTKPPKTLDELDALAAKLDKYSANSIDRFGFIPWLDYGNDNPFYWGWMFGAKIFDTASQEAVPDGKAARRRLQVDEQVRAEEGPHRDAELSPRGSARCSLRITPS